MRILSKFTISDYMKRSNPSAVRNALKQIENRIIERANKNLTFTYVKWDSTLSDDDKKSIVNALVDNNYCVEDSPIPNFNILIKWD